MEWKDCLKKRSDLRNKLAALASELYDFISDAENAAITHVQSIEWHLEQLKSLLR